MNVYPPTGDDVQHESTKARKHEDTKNHEEVLLMAKMVIFIRGINVGGKVMVPMAALKVLLETSGFQAVRTLLNSGNVMFQAATRKSAGIETLLEKEIAKRFGLAVDVMARGAADLQEVVAENPFLREAKEDPSHLLVMFFKKAVGDGEVKQLAASIKGREKLVSRGREIYVSYPDGIGASKLTNTVIEKTIGVRGTGRNWNTLLKVMALLQE